MTSSDNNGSPNLMDKAKGAAEYVVEGTKSNLEKARGAIHNATASPEEKKAEKSLQEKVQDKMPENASDAGQKIGEKVDEGISKIQDEIEKQQKK